MDDRFLFAFTDPSEVKLLGRKLFPFSIKHRVRLMAIKSPLIVSDRDIEPLDLILAAHICSESVFCKLSWFDYWYLKKLQRDKDFFEETILSFRSYSYYTIWPKFWEKRDSTSGSSDSGIGWPLMVVANLISNGITEDRAWNMPECQAIWLSTSFIKLKGGDVNILTTEEEEFMEEQSVK